MKITLKKVKTFLGREGHGLNADVYVDDVKTFFVMDDASGGCFYDHHVCNKEKYKELEAYVATLPEYPLVIDGKPYEKDGEVVMMKPTIDHLVDEAFEQHEKEKGKGRHEKRLQKLMLTKVLWGNEEEWRELSFKGFNIAQLLAHPKGPDALIKAIAKLKTSHPEGKLLNTNIPEEILQPSVAAH